MPKTTVLISRAATADNEKRAFEDALARALSGAGLPVLLMPHVYHLAEHDAIWQELAGLPGNVACISWLYPRPTEWVLRRHAISTDLLAFDMAAYDSPEACCTAVVEKTAPADGSAGTVRELHAEVTERWHPVVDYSRCVNCAQCMQFCLFGVYELDDADKLIVRNPNNCKPGCPACSRICPSGAIIFPLCETDTAIAGAPGEFMTPDPSAKVMFYKRTRKPCPICGRAYTASAAAGNPPQDAPVCNECGLPLDNALSTDSYDSASADAGASDDLDALIDDLERLR
ncbi:MAG: hypothetical protein HQ592_17075 [Planctomycetes bacterium]|nr:hypothetical protein [Planctomycetota bacterium]